MQLDYAILCQAASSQQGFMNILGGGVANVFLPSVPGPMFNVAVAINVWMEREEFTRPHTVDIRFIDEDGRPIPNFPNPPQIAFPAQNPPPPAEPNPHAHHNLQLVMPLHGVVIHAEGNFAIDILLDNAPAKRIPFRVAHVQMPPGQQPPGRQPPSPMPRMM